MVHHKLLEITMTSEIIKNKKDWSKWEAFFEDMANGKIPYSPSGWYIVDENPEWSKRRKAPNKPVINLVTPVAQTIEQAKADLKDNEKKKEEEQIITPRLKKRGPATRSLKAKSAKARKKERFGIPGSQYWK